MFARQMQEEVVLPGDDSVADAALSRRGRDEVLVLQHLLEVRRCQVPHQTLNKLFLEHTQVLLLRINRVPYFHQ